MVAFVDDWDQPPPAPPARRSERTVAPAPRRVRPPTLDPTRPPTGKRAEIVAGGVRAMIARDGDPDGTLQRYLDDPAAAGDVHVARPDVRPGKGSVLQFAAVRTESHRVVERLREALQRHPGNPLLERLLDQRIPPGVAKLLTDDVLDNFAGVESAVALGLYADRSDPRRGELAVIDAEGRPLAGYGINFSEEEARAGSGN